ncbi:helix-turn-helix domain-containing protein [Hominifimenecus sp. rT4P-3]|uniref:helix-turn-helix domain-containing protein n=1 Tax=Hominifimenecus sp. rT4P-3 TaxID=3242979 RepID=UPI003DA3DF46
MFIGDHLKDARKKKGYTLEQAAELTHIHKTTLHRYEKGEIHNIPLKKLLNLANIYDTNLCFLLGFTEPEPASKGFSARIMAYAERSYLPSEEKVLNKYRQLDTHSKHLINLMMDLEHIHRKN